MTAPDAPTWLGIDVGTSSVKVVVVADDGTVLGRGSSAYDTRRSGDDHAEQDPADYLDATAAAIAQSGAGERPVAAVGLVGQTPSLVAVDDQGSAVRPALIWQDQRAAAESRELAEVLGDPVAVIGTSLPWSPSGLAAMLLWLARHEPATLRRTRWLLQPKDFLGLALTDDPSSDPWSSKGLGTVVDPGPCRPVLDLAGVRPELVPPLRPAWTARGTVTAAASRRFGLPAGIPVSVGWSDALAGMLAVGAFDQPGAFALTGTSDIVGVTTADAPTDAAPLYAVPTSCAPTGVVYGPTSTSGAAVAWFADILGCQVPEMLELATAVPGDDVPVFVPYLDGERAPIWRSDVAGGFSGLRSRHGRAHLARAVLHGVVNSERHVLEVAERLLGHPVPGTVRTGGVGATHPVWLAARSALLGRPVEAQDEPALTAVGAAMLGCAAAAGGDLSAAHRLRAPGTVTAPTGTDRDADAQFARYRALGEFAGTVAR